MKFWQVILTGLLLLNTWQAHSAVLTRQEIHRLIYGAEEQAIPTLSGSDEENAKTLSGFYEQLKSMSSHQLSPEAFHDLELPMIEFIFRVRLEVNKRLRELQRREGVGPKTQNAARDLLRALRYTEEILGEFYRGYPQLSDGEKAATAFTGNAPELMVNRSMGRFEWKSGDVIMMRGSHFNSAAIARIGDADSQFSHVGILYIDPATDKKYIVQALIGKGVVITPFEQTMNEGVGRMAVFRVRTPDFTLGPRAAEFMFRKVQKAQREGKVYPYAFTMELDTCDEYFCSKVVREAFQVASEDKLMLPSFPSGLNHLNRAFLDAIGVKVDQTFAPGDMEIEPNFELVAEWRDFRMTPMLRLHDMALTEIYRWMEEDGLVFTTDLKVRASAKAAIIVNKIPFLHKALEWAFGSISSNMTSELIANMIMLQLTAKPLQEYLAEVDAEARVRTKLPLMPLNMLSALEAKKDELLKAKGRVYYLKPNPRMLEQIAMKKAFSCAHAVGGEPIP